MLSEESKTDSCSVISMICQISEKLDSEQNGGCQGLGSGDSGETVVKEHTAVVSAEEPVRCVG